MELSLEDCFAAAEAHRLELRRTVAEIERAERKIGLARSGYWPEVNLEGTWFKRGTHWDLRDERDMSHPEGWSVTAQGTWLLWDWGKRGRQVAAEKARMAQALKQHREIVDQVRFEVQEAFLEMRAAETNMTVARSALAQAEENARIHAARYRQQEATSTEVLDAQALLARSRSTYYRALYNREIAHAALNKAMGQTIVDPVL